MLSACGERPVVNADDEHVVAMVLAITEREGRDVGHTAKGKQGDRRYPRSINHVDAGNGFGVGSGTWALMRGTGQYEGLRGGGRLGQADATGRSGPWSERREGFLTLP